MKVVLGRVVPCDAPLPCSTLWSWYYITVGAVN